MNLIIVPVVCGPQMTKNALVSMLAQDVETHVLAVSNGSVDGSAQVMRALAHANSHLHIHENSSRVSLNKLWNRWIDYAFTRMCLDYVLVVNNDVVLREDTFRVLRDDGGLFVTAVGQRDPVDKTDRLTLEQMQAKRRPHPDFSCFLIRRECWDRVGRFDEEINAFYGDNDYHVRMHRAGVAASSLPIPFMHIASGTMKNASNDLRDAIQRESDADREVFKRKYGFLPATHEYEEAFR